MTIIIKSTSSDSIIFITSAVYIYVIVKHKTEIKPLKLFTILNWLHFVYKCYDNGKQQHFWFLVLQFSIIIIYTSSIVGSWWNIFETTGDNKPLNRFTIHIRHSSFVNREVRNKNQEFCHSLIVIVLTSVFKMCIQVLVR